MGSRLLGTGGLLLAVVLLFAVNILGARFFSGARADLTEYDLYTLSEGTKSILQKIDEPVTLRLYVSQKVATRLPNIKSYVDRVRQLLHEYERVAGGSLTLQIVDPEPFSEEEDRAVGYGLRGVPLNDGEATLYFGLVGTNSVGDEEAIPYLSASREQFLEYDVTRLVHTLANPDRKVVGLVTDLSMEGVSVQNPGQGSGQAWMVIDQVRELFEVESLGRNPESIPEEVDVLMVAHPKILSPQALYAIDQFVLRGGNALVFADPNSDSEEVLMMGAMNFNPDRRSKFDEQLAAWGVKLEDDVVVADMDQAVPVQMEREGRVLRFDYPVWINVRPDHFNQDDIITGDLGNVALGTPGSLVAAEGASTTFTPLIQTTPNAMAVTIEAVSMGADPEDLVRDYEPGGKRFTLAARVSGKVRTAFPDGPPPPPEPEAEGEAAASQPAPAEEAAPTRPHLAESEGEVSIVVIADSDLLHDRFWVQVQDFMGTRLAIPTAANGSLVVNSLDNLTGSGDLISVRNRGTFTRPFERIEALRHEAEIKFREKEQELIEKLAETEQRLAALEESKQGDESVLLSDAQQDELIGFRQERLRIRKELRDVRHELSRNIEKLEAWLKFTNIGLMPIVIGLLGVVLGLARHRRRQPGLAVAG